METQVASDDTATLLARTWKMLFFHDCSEHEFEKAVDVEMGRQDILREIQKLEEEMQHEDVKPSAAALHRDASGEPAGAPEGGARDRRAGGNHPGTALDARARNYAASRTRR